jgi:hypothetical protein
MTSLPRIVGQTACGERGSSCGRLSSSEDDAGVNILTDWNGQSVVPKSVRLAKGKG